MKVVFFGSSDFSIPSLQALFDDADINVACVYTQAPKPSGRGYSLTKTPVHTACEECNKTNIMNNIEIRTPAKLTADEIDHVSSINPDFLVVVSYGLILPKALLNTAKILPINIHPSALPRWRGAAPIERSIAAGDVKTSVCIIKMSEKLDEGDIILSEDYNILPTQNSLQLHNIFAKIGSRLMLDVLHRLYDGELMQITKQTESGAFYAKKVLKSELLISYKDSLLMESSVILNKIRAFTTCGYCFVILEEILPFKKRLKIISAMHSRDRITPIDINCLDGFASPTIVQPEGGSIMNISEFMRGVRMRK